jgi:hypothetical protein
LNAPRTSLLLAAMCVAACQRPLPPQVLQPVPAPLGPTAPATKAAAMKAIARPRHAGPPAIATCNLEGAGGQPFGEEPARLYRRSPARITGWAALPHSAPVRVELVAEAASGTTAAGAWQVPLPVDVERADVAAHLRSAAMLRSGFDAHVDFSALPAGDYSLRLFYGDGADRRRCSAQRTVQLVD